MSARLADVAHKTMVTVLAGVTVVGLVDIGMMHRNIMSLGKEEAAKREMDQLKELRESTQQPFPQGTSPFYIYAMTWQLSLALSH